MSDYLNIDKCFIDKIHTLKDGYDFWKNCMNTWSLILDDCKNELIKISPRHKNDHQGDEDCPMCYATKCIRLIATTQKCSNFNLSMLSIPFRYSEDELKQDKSFNDIFIEPIVFEDIYRMTDKEYGSIRIHPFKIRVAYPERLSGLRYDPIKILQKHPSCKEKPIGISIVVGVMEGFKLNGLSI